MDRLVRVLIIEDNVTRKVIAEILKNYSFEIIEAEDGRSRIESCCKLRT